VQMKDANLEFIFRFFVPLQNVTSVCVCKDFQDGAFNASFAIVFIRFRHICDSDMTVGIPSQQ
jgi:hypothetical protein